ncbi:MAG: thymidine kinase [Chitinophagales bacterium]|jgi:thymidine kinase|nr:thymidine kinase [Chitinophagales bacterium]HNI43865.1 thymidine kinase [Chitinophagales bacterium]
MFLEPSVKKGWIEVICGSMFSGKTEELIRRLRRATIANQQVKIFKAAIDTRYDTTNIVSHDAKTIPSIPVQKAADILAYVDDAEVIGIDEAQFFDEQLPMICETLAVRGVRVIIAGLDMDFLGKPFGAMPHLLAIAEYITKLHAICVQCGQLATHSYRKVLNTDKVVLGAKEAYEPRCRICYHEGENIHHQHNEMLIADMSND